MTMATVIVTDERDTADSCHHRIITYSDGLGNDYGNYHSD